MTDSSPKGINIQVDVPSLIDTVVLSTMLDGVSKALLLDELKKTGISQFYESEV